MEFQIFLVQKLLNLYESIAIILLKQKSLLPTLTLEQITILENVVRCLQPLEEATRKIFSGKFVTASLCIPLTTGLINILVNLQFELQTH